MHQSQIILRRNDPTLCCSPIPLFRFYEIFSYSLPIIKNKTQPLLRIRIALLRCKPHESFEGNNIAAYTSGVVETIVRGDAYAAAVKAKLGLYYSSHNVGATLPPADLEQLFIGMLVARIPVTDGPRIEAAMLDYFRQMDAFVSSANTIYQDNLSRQLEPEEEAALRDKFRAHDTDLNGIVAAVRGSFEYMHVLHDMVSSIAADLGVDSGKGKVFKLIESLIADNHDKSKVTLCMQARRLLSTA